MKHRILAGLGLYFATGMLGIVLFGDVRIIGVIALAVAILGPWLWSKRTA